MGLLSQMSMHAESVDQRYAGSVGKSQKQVPDVFVWRPEKQEGSQLSTCWAGSNGTKNPSFGKSEPLNSTAVCECRATSLSSRCGWQALYILRRLLRLRKKDEREPTEKGVEDEIEDKNRISVHRRYRNVQ